MNQAGIASQIIVGILSEEMGMPPDSVWLRDQNKKIPNDDGLYIVVGMVSAQTICVETYLKNGSPPIEVNEVQQRENIQIDVLSRSNAAIMRNWEVLAALRSIFSIQQQETNDFKIHRLPDNFINTSAAEGGYQLNRYTLTFPTFVWYRKSKPMLPAGDDYYDDFTTREDNEKTIGTDTPSNRI